MSSAAYYRAEAGRCRKLAATSPEREMAARWRQLASEYDGLADSLENAERRSPPPIMRAPMQQQQQQQQRTLEPDEEE